MSSAVELIVHHYVIALFALYLLGAVIVALIRLPVRPEKASNWPGTEGTIQSVGKVTGRNYSVDVGNFSYKVDDEYYSGRLTISSSFSTSEHSPRDLINQKIQVLYNPRKPDKFFFPQAELGGYRLEPYYEPFGRDIGPIDLNINKI
jgi:hypothetical protein